MLGPDGNIGVIQTMVGELVKKPEHERKPLTALAVAIPSLIHYMQHEHSQ